MLRWIIMNDAEMPDINQEFVDIVMNNGFDFDFKQYEETTMDAPIQDITFENMMPQMYFITPVNPSNLTALFKEFMEWLDGDEDRFQF